MKKTLVTNESCNNISILEVIEACGLKTQKKGTSASIIWVDGKPASGWKVNVAKNYVNSQFSWHEDRGQGEPLAFVMKQLKLSHTDALEWFGHTFPSQVEKLEITQKSEVVKEWKQDLEVLDLNFSDKSQVKHIAKLFERTSVSQETMKKLGIKYGNFKGHPALFFPLFGLTPHIERIGWQKRDLFASKAEFKSISLIKKWLLMFGEIKEEITILAGEIDALTALNIGYKGIVGLPGEGGSNEIWEWLQILWKDKKVTAICDNDEAGMKSAWKILWIFPEAHIFIPKKEGKIKDLNDLAIAKEWDKKEILSGLEGFKKDEENTIASMSDIFTDRFEDWTRIAEQKWFSSPWTALNENVAITGISWLVAIAGSNNVGKTAFTLQFSNHIASTKAPVLWLSFEHSDRELVQRSIAKYSDISLEEAIRGGKYSEYLHEGFGKLHAEWVSENLYIKHSSDLIGLNEEILLEWVKKIKKKSRSDGIVIVVDYLQKLPDLMVKSRSKDVRERINNNLTVLRRIINEEQACILLVSALNREAQKGDKSTPSITDFRDSGDIEYSADLALFLTNWADQINENTSISDALKLKSEIKLHTLKNRNNSTKSYQIDLDFDFKKMIFKEETRKNDGSYVF